jgi:MFS family permease
MATTQRLLRRPRGGPSVSQLPVAEAEDRRSINRLMLFFALVYIAEGIGEVDGLIAQPLSFYLKEVHGWTALQVSAYLTIFNFPWIIKPIYGALSDFVPLFGYRRKPYLLAANIVAACGFFWVTHLTAPGELLWALQFTAYAMAISSTVCGAVLVENGQRLGKSGKFVNQQWLWFNAATIIASIAGGELAQLLPPTSALHVAAAIVALSPLGVVFGTVFLTPDKEASIDLPALRAAFGDLVTAFRKRELWVVGLFLFLYHFNPGLNTPLYYYMTDDLNFSQGYIGILGSIEAAGWIVGALLYRKLFEDMSSKRLLNLSIALGTVTTAAFVFLVGETSAAILNFCSGFSAMVATVSTATLAADHCPPRSEGFTFAAMMSIINLSTSLSGTFGGFLFDHVLHDSLTPLVLLSAAFTAFALVLVPLLRLGDKRQGQSVAATTEVRGPQPLI